MTWGLGGGCIPLPENTPARNTVRNHGQNPNVWDKD